MQHNVSKKMSLIIGARRHLEWGHEKYIMDTIQSHPAQVIILYCIVSYYFNADVNISKLNFVNECLCVLL